MPSQETEPVTRRHFVGLVAAGAAVGPGLGLLGWRTARREPRVERYALQLNDLPEGFDGFRIVLLSDVHAGAHMDELRMSSLVRRVNSLGADLVVLAGDMIDGRATVAAMRSFTRAFRDLRAVHGVLAVPGNHEHFAGIDVASRAIRSAGLPLLCGESLTIERSGDSLAVLGVDDPTMPTFDPPQDAAVSAVAEKVPDGLVRILVAHRPAAFDAAARLGIALTLAGHTHGGQLGLGPRDLTPVRLVTQYVRGHYRRDGAHLIVSSGVGTGGMPLRLGVPPSVPLITLHRPGK